MTDVALRELERRWRSSGTVGDRTALLRERLRAGLIDRDRVGLAAHLRDEAAALVVPPPVVEVDTDSYLDPRRADTFRINPVLLLRLAPFEAWANMLEAYRVAALRTALAAVRWSLVRGSITSRDDQRGYFLLTDTVADGKVALDVIPALESFVLKPTKGHALGAVSACLRVREEYLFGASGHPTWLRTLGAEGLVDEPDLGWLGRTCRGAAIWSSRTRSACEEHAAAPSNVPVPVQIPMLTEPCPNCLFGCVHSIQDAVAAELVPWLLGDEDPLEEKGSAE